MKTQIGKDNQVELKHEFCKCFYSFSLLDPIPWCLLWKIDSFGQLFLNKAYLETAE